MELPLIFNAKAAAQLEILRQADGSATYGKLIHRALCILSVLRGGQATGVTMTSQQMIDKIKEILDKP